MHILYIADGDSKYGAINSLLQLISEIVKNDRTARISVILTKRSGRPEDFERIGCDVYRIPYEPFYQNIPYPYWMISIKFILCGILYIYGRIFAIRELEKRLDMKSVDIIHSNSSREDFSVQLSQKYNIPLVWHIREFGDLDYKCFSFRRNYISLMNESATQIIAVSKAVREYWIHKGIQEEKIIQVYNGVKPNERVKEHYPEKNDIIRFIMMGSINETKGQWCVIKAFAMLTGTERERIQLDIVGDGAGAYIKKLKFFIKKNNLTENIHFLGYRKNFYKELSQYDCGLMCSRCEAFGRVTAEYMMAGLPVIASNTGANPELVEDNVSGLLYQYNDIKDLSDKLSYLLNNETRISELGRNAYRVAKEKYTATANALNIFQVYRRILKFS